MTLEDLILQLNQKGVRLSFVHGELKVQAPRGVMTAALQAEIKEKKQDLIHYLSPALLSEKPMDFSVFFFSNELQVETENKYKLVLDATQYADQHGFVGVWTPERHFNELGGLFPNPAVLGAALSVLTKNLKIRAGSVVLPLQDPIRVTEEWAIVDQLSEGRVELSFATGWHANDFALARDSQRDYAQRHSLMYQRLDTVRALWQGNSVTRKDGGGQNIELFTFPRPKQKELPLWLTAIGNPDSYQKIAAKGTHLLTCLLDQDIDELGQKITLYRKSLKENGFNPSDFKVAVFVHTYVGEDGAAVKEEVAPALKNYLKNTLDLLGKLSQSTGVNLNPDEFTAADQETLLDFAFERYYEERSLMGDIHKCEDMVQALAQAGVDEIACLVDFGLPSAQVMQGLEQLAKLVKKHVRT